LNGIVLHHLLSDTDVATEPLLSRGTLCSAFAKSLRHGAARFIMTFPVNMSTVFGQEFTPATLWRNANVMHASASSSGLKCHHS
jgi:hypothetical protein